MTNLLCFVLVLVAGSFDLTKCEFYLITPSPSDICPVKACFTLSQFAANTSSFLDSNTTLILLPGHHILDRNLSASSVWSFRMLSDYSFMEPSSDGIDTNITCESFSMFEFNNVSLVYISGIQFVGCGGNRVESVHSFTIEKCSFIGANKTALELVETKTNIESTSFISNKNFVDSTRSTHDLNVYWIFGMGGAITVNQSKISIFNSRFEGNRANRGGAIFSERGSNITITNSSFVDNHALSFSMGLKGQGGAMYLQQTTLSSSFVYFDKNSAAGSGGVLRAYNCMINSTNDRYHNNRAHQVGGVLYGNRCVINSTNNQFYNNSARRSGGVMFIYYKTQVNSNNDYFFNNSAGSNGGVIAGPGTLFCNNNHFECNRADYNGGVMWSSWSLVNINLSYFNNNTAKRGGGVMWIEWTTLNSSYNEFYNNSAGDDGGVLWVQQTTINSDSDYFKNNKADNDGGVINADKSTINSRNDTFLNSRSGKKGGVIWATKSSIKSNNDLFHKNIAHRRGGVMWLRRSTILSSSVNFSNNRAGRKGGVTWARKSTIISNNDIFYSNRVHRSGGVMWAASTTVHSNHSNYSKNVAGRDGGVLVAYLNSNIHSQDDYFYNNSAGSNGGTFVAQKSKIFSNNDYFLNNRAESDGGVLWAYDSTIESYSDDFFYNHASRDGGAVYSHSVSSTYEMITAHKNSAGTHGGVFKLLQGSLKVNKGKFSSSSAKRGGVMHIDRLRRIQLNESLTFSDATAEMGSVFYISGSDFNSYGNLTMLHNTATCAVVYLMDCTVHLSGNTTLSNNKGSIVTIASKINFTDYVIVTSTRVSDRETAVLMGKFEEGGAITAIQSSIVFDGECKLSYNRARIGGAIRSIKSNIDVHGTLMIANNTATESGGGVYLYQSELTCQYHSKFVFLSNTATTNGGGIHAISSSINLKSNGSLIATSSMVYFIENSAELGGGAYLQLNSVIYISKYAASAHSYTVLDFTNNTAKYGGAVFVPDNTKFGECTEFNNKSHSISNECPFQVLYLHEEDSSSLDISKQNIHFSGNTAKNSGLSLYGGFFDTCTVSNLAERNMTNNINIYSDYFSPIDDLKVHETSYLQDISDISTLEIGTPPVKVCFCKDNKPDCTYQHPTIHTDRRTSITLAVFDEVGNVVRNGEVYGSLHKSNNGSFLHVYKNRYNQHAKSVDSECTNFVFSAFSIHPFDDLILYADPAGTCKQSVFQEIQLTLQFPWCDNCSIGFQKFDDQERGCRCDCHIEIKAHFTNCNATTQTLQKTSSVWIAYFNDTAESSGFIIHPHCPLDYCKPTDAAAVLINFSEENGADAQCANNRSGTLCGTCPRSLSLSLGSSQCLSCPKLWPILTVVIILLSLLFGIALVVLLLALNLTVAVGTLNGIIFYANIVAANSKILLPFSEPNFITVFISWLNLEFGIDACFFKGMDVYWKTWLQISFPSYVIFLVVMVIIISEQSMRFAHLIGKRNPIATLTTLILLSYAKFLHTIIAALSFATLKYPDGSRKTVWLPDGTVSYLTGKHIALFIAAMLILTLGIVYTVLLFSWQWLLRYQHKVIFKWVRNQKLCQFLEPYHAPYSIKQRYWTGLLLLVRVALYTVSATNVSGDPRVALVSTICLVGFLPLLKGFLAIRVYKNTLIDLMETFTYFNLMFLSAFSWYCLDTNPHTREAVAYTSVSITFILLIAVFIYHVHIYTGVFYTLKNLKYFNKFLVLFQANQERQPDLQDKRNYPLEFNDAILHNRVEPTYSVVEMHKPKLLKPDLDLEEGRSIPNLEPNVYVLNIDSPLAGAMYSAHDQTESDKTLTNEVLSYSRAQYSETIQDNEQISDTGHESNDPIDAPMSNISNSTHLYVDTHLEKILHHTSTPSHQVGTAKAEIESKTLVKNSDTNLQWPISTLGQTNAEEMNLEMENFTDDHVHTACT